MLGEAFLHVLNYADETPEHSPTTDQKTCSHNASTPEITMTHLTSKSPLTSRALRAGRPEGQEKPGPHRTSAPSMALTIPSCSVDDQWGMELYSSWNCPSICKAYPDLQLAGDTLRGPHLIPQSLGPFLQSQDLSSLEALDETDQEVDSQAKKDEGYLVIESMREPRLTNSMLNGYLETQLMEVYRQHMQDSLARCASSSLTTGVVPALVPADLNTSNGQISNQEDGLDSSSSQSSVQYLSTCSAPPTSHFSSPVLRISYPQEKDS